MTDNQGLLESILAAQIALLAREIRRGGGRRAC